MSSDGIVTPAPSAPEASTPAPEAPSGPPTSEAIITQALERLEDEHEDASAPEEKTFVAHNSDRDQIPVTETPAQPPPKELSIEEQLLQDHGFKEPRRPDGRENRIPRSKVLQMISSGLRRGADKWGTERTALEGERDALRADVDAMRAAVQGDPVTFLKELSRIDQRYATYLPQAKAPEPPAAPPAPEMPGPDLMLPDGAQTYSLDGIRKLLEWNTQMVRADVDARLKPITERDKQAKADAELARVRQEQQTRSQQTIAQMQTWEHFGPLAADGTLTPFQQAVMDVLRADSEQAKKENRRPMVTAREAYLEALAKKLAADATAVRGQVLAEMNAAPRSTSVPAQSVGITKPGQRSGEDVVREALTKIGAL